MYLTIKSLLNILPKNARQKARNLFFLITLVAFSDAIGVATIFPFMQLVTNAELISEVEFLNKISELTGVRSKSGFIVMIGLFMIIILTLNAYLKTLTLKRQIEFTQKTEAQISRQYLHAALCKPYKWHLNTNSSEIGKNILSEVNLIVHSGVLQLFILVSQGLIILSILTVLCFINASVTLSLILFGCLTYFSLYFLLKKRLHTLGEMRSEANAKRFLAVNEALSSFREVKINNLEMLFSANFYNYALKYADYQSKSNLMYHLPKFILEGAVFIIITFLLIFFGQKNQSLDILMPSLALFTFAGYKLLPAMNQLYLASTQIKYVANAAQNIRRQTRLNTQPTKIISDETHFKSLSVHDLSFSYDEKNKTVLNNISLTIDRGIRLAIIGESGSGKTTLVDVLLGLLEPSSGSIELNSDANKSLIDLKKVSYVSQQMYFSDDTIRNNLNIKRQHISEESIKTAIQTVGLDLFINQLEKQYDYIIGENGEKLSGGQRQRLGIARSLVQHPEVLVLDEATSALDAETENRLMKNLKASYPDMTIIMITHRLNTLQGFDKIIVLSEGSIAEVRTFEDHNANSRQTGTFSNTLSKN